MSCNVTSCETWTRSELWRSSRLTLFIYRRRMLRDKTGNGLNEKPSCYGLKLKFIETKDPECSTRTVIRTCWTEGPDIWFTEQKKQIRAIMTSLFSDGEEQNVWNAPVLLQSRLSGSSTCSLYCGEFKTFKMFFCQILRSLNCFNTSERISRVLEKVLTHLGFNSPCRPFCLSTIVSKVLFESSLSRSRGAQRRTTEEEEDQSFECICRPSEKNKMHLGKLSYGSREGP